MPGGRSVRITDILNFENSACAENFFTFAPNFNEAQSEHHSNSGSRKKKKKANPTIHKKIFSRVYSRAKIFVLCLFNSNA